jgi:hypothetical protein
MAKTYKVVTTITVKDNDLMLGDWLLDAIYEKMTEGEVEGDINTFQIMRIADHYVDTHIAEAKNDIQIQLLDAA